MEKLFFFSLFFPFYTKLPVLHKSFYVIMGTRFKSWKKEPFKLKECWGGKPAMLPFQARVTKTQKGNKHSILIDTPD